MPETTVLEAPDPERTRAERGSVGRKRSASYWTRWLHVYASMFSLLIVLFFGLTGITLNHPNWAFGGTASVETATGTLPDGFVQDGTVDFLAVVEYVRIEDNVRGSVVDYRADATNGVVSFKGPGYAADVTFDLASGGYDVTAEREGLVAVMNDLHKGRDTNSSWSWVIDVAGGLLVLVSGTGLGVQLFMRKRRTRALIVAGTAALVASALMYLTFA